MKESKYGLIFVVYFAVFVVPMAIKKKEGMTLA